MAARDEPRPGVGPGKGAARTTAVPTTGARPRPDKAPDKAPRQQVRPPAGLAANIHGDQYSGAIRALNRAMKHNLNRTRPGMAPRRACA